MPDLFGDRLIPGSTSYQKTTNLVKTKRDGIEPSLFVGFLYQITLDMLHINLPSPPCLPCYALKDP
ncbi:MAG: hypothetical protein QNJ18_15175 [Xenococcaceae cyanobacterium MO_167.B52]|nr:hypothetical protein [Xenococcaceae cyanobacterium MO_167.B52]